MELDIAAGLQQAPPELQALHDALYEKIKQMTCGQAFNPSQDPQIMQAILESAMQMIEKLRKTDGTSYTGAEKKTMAIAIIKWVITDLGKNGVIPKDIAAEVTLAISILGGPAIDLAVAAANGLYNFGKKVVADIEAKIEANQAANNANGTKPSKCCLWC